jgi:hypothetical protein
LYHGNNILRQTVNYKPRGWVEQQPRQGKAQKPALITYAEASAISPW